VSSASDGPALGRLQGGPLAGIGDLPETVRDRAIEIEMKRKLVTESVKRLRRRDGADLNEIARKLARWSLDTIDKLRTPNPKCRRGSTIAPRTPGSRWLPSAT
jgi:hypothetical protein